MIEYIKSISVYNILNRTNSVHSVHIAYCRRIRNLFYHMIKDKSGPAARQTPDGSAERHYLRRGTKNTATIGLPAAWRYGNITAKQSDGK